LLLCGDPEGLRLFLCGDRDGLRLFLCGEPDGLLRLLRCGELLGLFFDFRLFLDWGLGVAFLLSGDQLSEDLLRGGDCLPRLGEPEPLRFVGGDLEFFLFGDPLFLGGGDLESRRRAGGDPDPLRLGIGERLPLLLGGGELDPRRLGGGDSEPFLLGGGEMDPLRLGGGDLDPCRLGDPVPRLFIGGGLLDVFLRGGGLPDPLCFGGGELRRLGGGLPDTLRLGLLTFLFCLRGGGLPLGDRLTLRFGGGEPLPPLFKRRFSF